MSLPSQSHRPSSNVGRGSMHRSRSSGNARKVGLALGAVLVLVVGAWALTRDGDGVGGPKDAEAKQPEQDKTLAVNIPVVTPPPPKPVEPEPLEIRQGRGGDTGPALGNTSGAVVEEPKTSAPEATPEVGAGASAEVQSMIAAGKQKLASGDPVAARVLLSRALAGDGLGMADRDYLRQELTRINEELVFSPRIVKDDPFVEAYTIQSGDNLTVVARKLKLGTDRRLIARVNKMANPDRVVLGQKLKIVKGPFHAVVTKSAYRLDLYMGPADRPQDWVYVRSFRVGLGEANGTPVGTFIAKRGSKLVDPPWINPRTGERFEGKDPKNPIGHRWIGIEGVGESAQHTGYGLHGTIDPESIGQQRSMGCVRMGKDDIELMYELMGEGVSMVRIVP